MFRVGGYTTLPWRDFFTDKGSSCQHLDILTPNIPEQSTQPVRQPQRKRYVPTIERENTGGKNFSVHIDLNDLIIAPCLDIAVWPAVTRRDRQAIVWTLLEF